MSEEWHDKVFVKKRWKIHEEELVEIVSKRILTPYWKRPTDGIYIPLPWQIEVPHHDYKWQESRLWGEPRRVKVTNYVRIDITEEQIRKAIKSDYIWFRHTEIEDAEYEEKISLPPAEKEQPKAMYLSEAGQKGGLKRKKNPIISEAIQLFLEKYPKLTERSYTEISSSFIKKHPEKTPLCVNLSNDCWEVFHYAEHIFWRAGENHNNRKTKSKEKSITIGTFVRNYIPDGKKAILSKNSK